MAKQSAFQKQNDKWDQHDTKLHGKNLATYFGNLDQSSTSDGAGPGNNVYVGTGNTADNYNVFVNHDADIELGLKVHYRQGPDIRPTSVEGDGSEHYEAPSGTQPGNPSRAAWNFDFSVNTGIEGSTRTLDAYSFRIVIESGDGERAVFVMQNVAPGVTPWVNEAGAGFTDDDGATNAQISQNSVNFGFAFMQAIFGADYNDAGEHYEIELQAFGNGNQLIGIVTDSIDIV